MIENGAQLGRAMTQTRITVDALCHLDPQWRVLPLRVSGTSLNSFAS